MPSLVTSAVAEALRAETRWKATRGAILRDATIQAAANEGRGLREGTRAAAWFDALAEEVVG